MVIFVKLTVIDAAGHIFNQRRFGEVSCAGCNTFLNNRALDGICDTCYSDSIVSGDDGYVLYLEDSLSDDMTAEEARRFHEVYSQARETTNTHRRRAKSDAFRMRTLGMSLRQFCAYKIRHNLDEGKVYIFNGFEYP